ncbi:MAG: DUF1566 domain-containing protein, partial [Myxococcaceae bacterium]
MRSLDPTTSQYARCVRSGSAATPPPGSLAPQIAPLLNDTTWANWNASTGLYLSNVTQPNRYLVSSAGVVKDKFTGLEWEQFGTTGSFIWDPTFSADSAQMHCLAKATGGYRDWRLPTQVELQTLLNYATSNPATDNSTFPNTKSDYYWSSVGNPQDYTSALAVDFGYGYIKPILANSSNYVRCVRTPVLNGTRLSQLEAAQVIYQINGIALNQPYYAAPIQQKRLQTNVKSAPVTPIIDWVGSAVTQFGLDQPQNMPVYVAGALRMNLDYLIDDHRISAATHKAFSTKAATMAAHKATIATIQNPRMPAADKVRLTKKFYTDLNGTVHTVSTGAGAFSVAAKKWIPTSNVSVRKQFAESGFDFNQIADAASNLVSQGSDLSGLIGTAASSLLPADFTNVVSGVSDFTNSLQNVNFGSVDIGSTSSFLLSQVTGIPTDTFTSFDSAISGFTDTLNNLGSGFDPSSLGNLADSVLGKLGAGQDVMNAVQTVSQVTGFISDVSDVIGTASDVLSVVSDIGSVVEGIGAFAMPELMGGLLALGPIGVIADIGIGLGSLIGSLFGGGNNDDKQFQQISKEIQQVSKQIQGVGEYLGGAISNLSTLMTKDFVALSGQIKDGFNQTFQDFSALSQQVANGFNQTHQDIVQLNSNMGAQFNATDKLIVLGFNDTVNLLNEDQKQVLQGLQQISNQISQSDQQLLSSMQQLATISSAQLNSLLKIIDKNFQTLYHQDYENLQTEYVRYYESANYGQVPQLEPASAVEQAFLKIVNWVAVDTKNSIFHGDSANDYSIQGVCRYVQSGNELDGINELFGFLTQPAGYGNGNSLNLFRLAPNSTRPFVPSSSNPCPIPSDNQRFVHPTVWANMATDLMTFVLRTPEFSLNSGDRCRIQDTVQAGEDFLGAILSLRTNSALFDRLIGDYQNAFNSLVVNLYTGLVTSMKLTPQNVAADKQQVLALIS